MSQTMRALTLIIGFLFAPLVQAAVVTYGFTGLVDHVSAIDTTGAIPDSIVAGQSTVVGYFTFDDAASDVDPEPEVGIYQSPAVAIYMLFDGAIDYRGSLGSLTTGGVAVYDNLGTPAIDGFEIGLNPEPTSAISAFDTNVVSTALGIYLLSNDTSLLNSDTLLGLNLEAIFAGSDNIRHFVINAKNVEVCPVSPCVVSVIEGTVTSLWRIPEPATLALFGIGLAGLGAVRRKKLAA